MKTNKSTASASTSVSATASTKAATDATTKAAIKISAKLIALVSTGAKATAAKIAATNAEEQTIIVQGKAVAAELGKMDRTEVQKALKPIFDAAYKAVAKDPAYATQQLSRVLAVAFPGGNKAKPEIALKCAQARDRGIAEKMDTNTIIKLSTGKLAFTKAGKVVPVKKTGNRQGGSNAKTPLETLTTALDNAITAFVTVGKGEPVQVLNVTLSALVACKAIKSDEADEISAAIKKAI